MSEQLTAARQPTCHSGAPIVDTVGLGLNHVRRTDVESWFDLLTESAPDQPILWVPRWSNRAATSVRGIGHLAVLISCMPVAGDFAGVEWAHGSGGWCQVMRVDDGWIVEVHDGSEADFATKVLDGERAAKDDRGEFWRSVTAAEVMWSWLHGSLRAGCTRQAVDSH